MKDMCGYNGMSDPDDHLDAYLDWMNMQGASDALKCKIFSLTLVGDARTWITGATRGTLSTLRQSNNSRGKASEITSRGFKMQHIKTKSSVIWVM
ncbi:hypothetical protein ACOSP7_005086 [Xanthoceras sorbifolium]